MCETPAAIVAAGGIVWKRDHTADSVHPSSILIADLEGVLPPFRALFGAARRAPLRR